MDTIRVSVREGKVYLKHINDENAIDEEELPVGSFTNMKDAQMKAYEVIQFRRYFITYLQEIFSQEILYCLRSPPWCPAEDLTTPRLS